MTPKVHVTVETELNLNVNNSDFVYLLILRTTSYLSGKGTVV